MFAFYRNNKVRVYFSGIPKNIRKIDIKIDEKDKT